LTFLISASSVARIMSVSHWHPASSFYKNDKWMKMVQGEWEEEELSAAVAVVGWEVSERRLDFGHVEFEELMAPG
jgi:hypothetical protein